MNLVLVSDIFGKTAALKALAEELNAQSIVDPYGGVDMAFKQSLMFPLSVLIICMVLWTRIRIILINALTMKH